MALKFSSKAKAVRIRIKSGGEEHSSLGTLCENFCVADILEILADGRLERWLERQSDNADSNYSKVVKTGGEIVTAINAFKCKYKTSMQTENEWKQACGNEEVKTELIQCFFSVDSKNKRLCDIIKWFHENNLINNVNLTINENLIENNPEWAVWVLKNLPFTPKKGWIGILSKFSENGEALWFLHKEYLKNNKNILALKAFHSAKDKGYQISGGTYHNELKSAKNELGGENDETILNAHILCRRESITKENLLTDFGFAKYQMKYAGKKFPETIDKVKIMEYYGIEGLMWLGKLSEGLNSNSAIKSFKWKDTQLCQRCYQKAAERGNTEAKKLVNKFNSDVEIPTHLIRAFLLDPQKNFPDLTKYILNKDIREDVLTLLKIAREILISSKFDNTHSNTYDMANIIRSALTSNNYTMHRSIIIELRFLIAIEKWYKHEIQNIGWEVFEDLAKKNYKPACEIYNYQLCYNATFPQTNKYLNRLKSINNQELDRILTDTRPWDNKYLYEMIVYFIAHFVEYRKNQYKDVE